MEIDLTQSSDDEGSDDRSNLRSASSFRSMVDFSSSVATKGRAQKCSNDVESHKMSAEMKSLKKYKSSSNLSEEPFAWLKNYPSDVIDNESVMPVENQYALKTSIWNFERDESSKATLKSWKSCAAVNDERSLASSSRSKNRSAYEVVVRQFKECIFTEEVVIRPKVSKSSSSWEAEAIVLGVR